MRRTGLAVLVLLALAGVGAADSGIVAEWHFDEGSGSVLHDSLGNGNDGVIHGATWVDGKVGGAMSFDGMDDYVDCGNDASLDITEAITIEVWVYSNADGAWQSIVPRRGSPYNNQYSLSKANSNKIMFDSGPSWWGICSNSVIPTNQWVHIAVTYVSSTKQAHFYLNGGTV